MSVHLHAIEIMSWCLGLCNHSHDHHSSIAGRIEDGMRDGGILTSLLLCAHLSDFGHRMPSEAPKGGWGCLMSPPCLESQGCHLISFCCLLSFFFCLVLLTVLLYLFLPAGPLKALF